MIKMTPAEWQAYRSSTLARCNNIAEAKNKDYTAGSGDIFANFRMAEAIGMQPEMGIMLRMMDKMQRVRSFVQVGTLAVKEESAQDAVDDLINYALLLGGMLKERTRSLTGVNADAPIDPKIVATAKALVEMGKSQCDPNSNRIECAVTPPPPISLQEYSRRQAVEAEKRILESRKAPTTPTLADICERDDS